MDYEFYDQGQGGILPLVMSDIPIIPLFNRILQGEFMRRRLLSFCYPCIGQPQNFGCESPPFFIGNVSVQRIGNSDTDKFRNADKYTDEKAKYRVFLASESRQHSGFKRQHGYKGRRQMDGFGSRYNQAVIFAISHPMDNGNRKCIKV